MKNMRVLFAAALGMMACVSVDAAESWKVYSHLPNGTMAGAEGLKQVLETVEKETGGAIKFQMNLAGSLPIAASDITQAVADNIVQFGDDGFFLGNITIAGILRQPLLLKDSEEYAKALAIVQPHVERAYEKKGVLMLGTYHYPLITVFGNKPIASLADLQGKKLRMTSPEQAAFLKAFGGSGITVNPPDVPSSIQRGAVDGVLTAASGGGRIWQDLLTHNFRLGLDYFQGFFIVNKEAFGKLPPAVQASIRANVAKVAPTITDRLHRTESEAVDEFRKRGMIITEATGADVAEATKRMSEVWAEWAKSRGAEHEKVLAEVRQALGK